MIDLVIHKIKRQGTLLSNICINSWERLMKLRGICTKKDMRDRYLERTLATFQPFSWFPEAMVACVHADEEIRQT